jgi:hypothetical protein
VPTLVCDPPPPEFAALLERRRQLVQDLLDEVWDGVLHIKQVPASGHARVQTHVICVLGPARRAAGLAAVGLVNIGEASDYRVVDGALLRPSADGLFLSSAAFVLEVLAPDDETWEKLPLYAAHAVDEVVVVDREEHRVHWLTLRADKEYVPLKRSALVGLGPVEPAGQIDWPS